MLLLKLALSVPAIFGGLIVGGYIYGWATRPSWAISANEHMREIRESQLYNNDYDVAEGITMIICMILAVSGVWMVL